MKPFWSVAALKAAGFEGFTSVRALRRRRFIGIPDKPGIYITLYRRERAPRLLQVSPAYSFKGRDPALPITELRDRWVSGTRVIYIGKAGSKNGRSTLIRRISCYLRSGKGHACAHWGGRAIWQLRDAETLVFAWKPTSRARAAAVERSLIANFVAAFGKRPFANRTGGKPQRKG